VAVDVYARLHINVDFHTNPNQYNSGGQVRDIHLIDILSRTLSHIIIAIHRMMFTFIQESQYSFHNKVKNIAGSSRTHYTSSNLDMV
jgi:hypothetical protein